MADKTWRMKTNELGTVIWYSTTYTLFNQGGETKVQKFKELLEKQLYKKPLNPETPSFSPTLGPTQHYNVKLEIDKIWNAVNSIRSSIYMENASSVNSLIREISELQTTIAHLRSENSSLKTANRLLKDELSNNKTLQDELLSIIDSTKETAQQTERSAAKHTEYEQIFQQAEEMNYKDSFTVQLERIRKEKKEKFERHRNKNSEAKTENDRSICSNIPIALLVDTPKVNAHYDPDGEIFEAVDILHENKETKSTLAVENEELEKQIKTLKEKLDRRELENEKLKNEVRSLEAKLKPGNTEKVKKKGIEKRNAQNDKDQNSVKSQNKRSVHVVGDSMLNMIQENYNVNTKTANVKIHAFSGAIIEDLHDYILPIARKEPDNLIIHAGTNNIRNDTSEKIVEKLMQLHDHVSSIASASKIALSDIIRRHDFIEERLQDKIINTNTLLA